MKQLVQENKVTTYCLSLHRSTEAQALIQMKAREILNFLKKKKPLKCLSVCVFCFTLSSSAAHCSHWEQLLLSTKPLDALDIRYDSWVRAVKERYCPSSRCKVCLPGEKPTKGHSNDEIRVLCQAIPRGC